MRRAARKRDRRDDQTGAAAVEFALIMPVFVMVVFGIIAFGIVFAQQLALGNSARQAARYGVVSGRTCSQIVDEAKSSAGTIGMNGANVNVTVKVGSTAASASDKCSGAGTVQPCTGSTSGQNVYVTAAYTSSLIVPLVVINPSFDLTGTGAFRCEYS